MGGEQLVAGDGIAAARLDAAGCHVGQPHRCAAGAAEGDRIHHVAVCIHIVFHRAHAQFVGLVDHVGQRVAHRIEGTAHVVVAALADGAVGGHVVDGVGGRGDHAVGIDRCAATQMGGHGLIGGEQLRTVDGLAAERADLARAQVAQRGGGTALPQRRAGVVHAAIGVEVIAQRALLRCLQLAQVDRIGRLGGRGHVGDLPFRTGSADGDGVVPVGQAAGTDGDAVGGGGLRVAAHGDGVGAGCQRFHAGGVHPQVLGATVADVVDLRVEVDQRAVNRIEGIGGVLVGALRDGAVIGDGADLEQRRGEGTGGRIEGGAAAEEARDRIVAGEQLAAVDRFGAAGADRARCQVGQRGGAGAVAQGDAAVIRVTGFVEVVGDGDVAERIDLADRAPQLRDVDRIGVGTTRREVGDLPFATVGTAHRHFTGGHLRSGQAEGGVAGLRPAQCGRAVAQGHRVGLVGGGLGTEQGLPVGGADGAVADDHRMAHARGVVGGGDTGGVGRIVGAVAGEGDAGIDLGQFVARVGADHHFPRAIGISAVTHQHLVVLCRVDRPAGDVGQADVQALGRPVRRLVRQQQAEQAARVAVVDVVDVAVRRHATDQGEMRVAAGDRTAQAIQRGADRGGVDQRNAQQVDRRIRLHDVGGADIEVAVGQVAGATEQAGGGRADQ